MLARAASPPSSAIGALRMSSLNCGCEASFALVDVSKVQCFCCGCELTRQLLALLERSGRQQEEVRRSLHCRAEAVLMLAYEHLIVDLCTIFDQEGCGKAYLDGSHRLRRRWLQRLGSNRRLRWLRRLQRCLWLQRLLQLGSGMILVSRLRSKTSSSQRESRTVDGWLITVRGRTVGTTTLI